MSSTSSSTTSAQPEDQTLPTLRPLPCHPKSLFPLTDHTNPDIARLHTIIHKLQQENYHLRNCNQLLTDALQEADLHNQRLHADCAFYRAISRPIAHDYGPILYVKPFRYDIYQ